MTSYIYKIYLNETDSKLDIENIGTIYMFNSSANSEIILKNIFLNLAIS